jgi:hypothetical protein
MNKDYADGIQFTINLLALGFTGLLIWMNIYAINNNGIVIVDFNTIGEMYFELCLLSVTFIFISYWIIKGRRKQ